MFSYARASTPVTLPTREGAVAGSFASFTTSSKTSISPSKPATLSTPQHEKKNITPRFLPSVQKMQLTSSIYRPVHWPIPHPAEEAPLIDICLSSPSPRHDVPHQAPAQNRTFAPARYNLATNSPKSSTCKQYDSCSLQDRPRPEQTMTDTRGKGHSYGHLRKNQHPDDARPLIAFDAVAGR